MHPWGSAPIRLGSVFECERTLTLNQGSPLAGLSSFDEKAGQSVSQLGAAALPLMSVPGTACRHQGRQLGLGGARPSLLPPQPAGSHQPCTTCVTSCGFPLCIRKRNHSLAGGKVWPLAPSLTCEWICSLWDSVSRLYS